MSLVLASAVHCVVYDVIAVWYRVVSVVRSIVSVLVGVGVTVGVLHVSVHGLGRPGCG